MTAEVNPLDPDTRPRCVDCKHRQRGYCVNARQALLSRFGRAEVGPALANLRQQCPGFGSK